MDTPRGDESRFLESSTAMHTNTDCTVPKIANVAMEDHTFTPIPNGSQPCPPTRGCRSSADRKQPELGGRALRDRLPRPARTTALDHRSSARMRSSGTPQEGV